MKAFGYFVIILITPAFLLKFIVAVLFRRRHPDMSGTLIRSNARPQPPGATVPRPVHGTAFPACSAGVGSRTSQYLATVENGSVVENVLEVRSTIE